MPHNHLWKIVAALGAALLISTTPVRAEEKSFAAAKAFPMLESYFNLPPAERDLFRPAYYLRAKTGALTGTQIWLAVGNQRTAIPSREDGRLLPTPTAQQMRDGANIVFKFPDGVKAGIRMKLEAVVPLSADVKPEILDRALAQASSARRKAGGFMALFAGSLQRVVFVGAAAGDLIATDGTHTPLALSDGNPTYVAGSGKPARLIHLRATPRALWLEDE